MTRKEKIAENINDLLPDSSSLLGSDGVEARQVLVEKKAADIHERKSARELAKARFAIRANQEAAVAEQAVTKYVKQKNQAREEAIKQLEDENPYITAEEAIEKLSKGQWIMIRQGSAAKNLEKLLPLFEATANENQLKAIYKNKKVPVAIKTVIKRLLDDATLGNIETVEKLWDRIFGKAGMMLNLPEQTQQMTGIIPNTPVSREAYIVIRDTLLK